MLECWSGGVVRSPRWLPWIVKRFGEMRVRVGDETVNGHVARWPHRVRAGTGVRCLCYKVSLRGAIFRDIRGVRIAITIYLAVMSSCGCWSYPICVELK